MPKPRRHLLVFLLLPFLLAAQQQKPHTKATDLQGILTHENAYSNSLLGLTIVLPRKWQVVDEGMRKFIGGGSSSEAQDQDCDGALCNLQIDVSLITKPGQAPVDYISLSAYKVPPRYLDRERYPLKALAKRLTIDSAPGSGWTIDGDLTPIQIDGKPAYRLLAHISDRIVKKKGYMYVGEANGYVFILIGTTSYMMNGETSPKLQSAIENMKLQAHQQPEGR
jgi:hypothetical protein